MTVFTIKLLTGVQRKMFFLLTLVSSFFICSCAQSFHKLKNAKAFYQQRFAGTIAVDEHGNQITRGVDTVRWIIVESHDADELMADTVYFFGSAYSTSITLVDSNGNKNRIWKIETNLNLGSRGNDGKVRFTGIKNGKRYWVDVKNIVEIEAEMRN